MAEDATSLARCNDCTGGTTSFKLVDGSEAFPYGKRQQLTLG